MPAARSFDAIIIGAGAAGMFCAAIAGQRGRRILLLDHSPEPGRKILISGGGRCNFTNLGAVPERFLSANPHFAKSALGRYRPEDFIGLVNRHRIAWHEKTLGQLFCDDSAKQIIQMLTDDMAAANVVLRLKTGVDRLDRASEGWSVGLSDGSEIAAAMSSVSSWMICLALSSQNNWPSVFSCQAMPARSTRLMKSCWVKRRRAEVANRGFSPRKFAGPQPRLVKLQRPPPEMRIFSPGLAA